MLYLETPEGFVPWNGQPIDDIVYPLDIEKKWSATELMAVRLFKPVDPGIPEGKRALSVEVVLLGDEVTYWYELEDIPPPTPSDVNLTDRQLRIGLLTAGYSLAVVEAAIAGIEDPIGRAIAQVWWDRTTTIQWDHPMTQTLMGLAGIPENERVLLWMWASDIPA
jgi:hypothetical protein